MSLFEKLKKLFEKEEPKWKKKNTVNSSNKDYSGLTEGTSMEGVDLNEFPPAFKQLTIDTLSERKELQKFWDSMLPVLTVSSKNRKSVISLKEIPLEKKSSVPLSFPSKVYQYIDILFGVPEGNEYKWLNYGQMEIADGLPLTEIPNWGFQNLYLQIGQKITPYLEPNGLYKIKNGGAVLSSLTMMEEFWEKIFLDVSCNNVLFGIPERSCIIFIKGDDQERIDLLQKSINSNYNSANDNNKLNKIIYIKEKGKNIRLFDTTIKATNKSPLQNDNDSEESEVNLDKIFPRLKNGQVENSESIKVKGMVNGEIKEFDMPKSALLFGIDLGPDFTCCFALDLGHSFQLLTNGHFENIDSSKEELLQRSFNNFIKEYGSKIQVSGTDFSGVQMLKIDGNTEAVTILMIDLWKKIQTQLNLKKLFVVIPLQDIVLFWDELEEGVLESLLTKVESTIKNQPASRRISEYLFEFRGDRFEKVGKFINFEKN